MSRRLPALTFKMSLRLPDKHPLDHATEQAWLTLVERITCLGPVPIKFTMEDHHYNEDAKYVPIRLRASMATQPTAEGMLDPKYIPGGPYNLEFVLAVKKLGPPSITTLYKIARMLYAHELMEWFRVDGEHHEHPHPGWNYTLDHPEGLSVRDVNKERR